MVFCGDCGIQLCCCFVGCFWFVLDDLIYGGGIYIWVVY